MERGTSQQDTVFCHQCENEWSRADHGLTCPECHSDFTEIIEPDNDPRDDHILLPEDEDDSTPGFDTIHDHNPWQDAPDPAEEDIDRVHWRSTGPNTMSFHGTFYRTVPSGFGGSAFGPNGPTPPNMYTSPIAQNFATMLQGIAGTGPRPPTHPPTHPMMQRVPPSRGPNQQFEIRGPSFTLRSSTNVYPSTPGAQPTHEARIEELHSVLNQIFHGLGPQQGGEGMGHGAGPLMNPFAQLFHNIMNPASAISGDAVYTQEALDRVISQLMEQNPAGSAPGPASAEAIEALPRKKVDKSMLDEATGKAECSICMDQVELGDTVTSLPCEHWFHHDCIKAWLDSHDSCPQCRMGITPKEGQDTAPRAPGQDPLHDQRRWLDNRPVPVPPQQQMHSDQDARPSASRRSSGMRRSPTNGASSSGSAGGITERVRNFFSGSSSNDR